jgi:hypothetical protein
MGSFKENRTLSVIWDKLQGPSNSALLGGFTGSGLTTGISVAKGAKCNVTSDCSSLGVTEISLDGVAYTLAAMRANSPKLVTNTYGSLVYE